MIIGKLLCKKCGNDCTGLYGFALMTRGSISPFAQRELEAVKKKFGESEWVFCWGCTAEFFGVKPLEEKSDLPNPKAGNAPFQKDGKVLEKTVE